jgi:aminoglycoside 2''-phosphotransferase
MIEHIFRKHPELKQETVRSVSHGWANQVLIVGERLVFRFPRTAQSKRELWREQQVLAALAPLLPLRVPEFLYFSDPDDAVTYVGYEQIPGTPLTRELFDAMSPSERSEFGVTLGAFLTTLHTYETSVPLPIQKKERWEAFYREIEEKAFPLLSRKEQEETSELFANFLGNSAHFAYTPRLLHGDLSSDHLLAESGKLTGVIDFGDLCFGDPASVSYYPAWPEHRERKTGAGRARSTARKGVKRWRNPPFTRQVP